MIKWIVFFFLISCSHLFYQPDQRIYSDPDQVGYRKSELMVPSQKRMLHTWLIESAKKKTNQLDRVLIVQFHGNAQNISSHFASLAWTTHDGATLLTFDWSGYGKSQGMANQENLFHDALAIIEYAKNLKKEKAYNKLVFVGQSLGGAVLSRAIIEENQSPITLLVLDSTFSSYQKISKQKLQQNWITYLLSPLTSILISDEYASTDYLSRISISTLVIHAKEDSIVPYNLGLELFEQLKCEKKMWTLNSRAHISAFYEFGNHYRDLFKQMIIDSN
jgi:predicted alpha/beta-fold hydrolase